MLVLVALYLVLVVLYLDSSSSGPVSSFSGTTSTLAIYSWLNFAGVRAREKVPEVPVLKCSRQTQSCSSPIYERCSGKFAAALSGEGGSSDKRDKGHDPFSLLSILRTFC